MGRGDEGVPGKVLPHREQLSRSCSRALVFWEGGGFRVWMLQQRGFWGRMAWAGVARTWSRGKAVRPPPCSGPSVMPTGEEGIGEEGTGDPRAVGDGGRGAMRHRSPLLGISESWIVACLWFFWWRTQTKLSRQSSCRAEKVFGVIRTLGQIQPCDLDRPSLLRNPALSLWSQRHPFGEIVPEQERGTAVTRGLWLISSSYSCRLRGSCEERLSSSRLGAVWGSAGTARRRAD